MKAEDFVRLLFNGYFFLILAVLLGVIGFRYFYFGLYKWSYKLHGGMLQFCISLCLLILCMLSTWHGLDLIWMQK